MRRSHISIYRSRRHVAVTLALAALPFVFFVIFSRITDIALDRLLGDLGISVVRLAAAYLISAVCAWGLAVLFYKGKRSLIALPIFDVLQSFPTFAIVPLAALYLGRTNGTVIFFLVITVIWPIVFSIISSLKLIKHDWEEVAEIAGLTGFDYVRYFLWPVSVPGLITGSIIGLGEGWEALVATEIIMNIRGGLGSFFGAHVESVEITAFGVAGLLLFIFAMNKIIWLPLLESSHRRMEE